MSVLTNHHCTSDKETSFLDSNIKVVTFIPAFMTNAMTYDFLSLISHGLVVTFQAKEKYRGIFEIQKSGDKTSLGKIGLDIRTYASPKVGQDQVSKTPVVRYLHFAVG